MGHGSPFFKSPFEFSHFPFSGWIHQFHEFPSLVPMEKSPWKSPIISSDKAPKNCRSHTSWCTSGISCWSPWPSRKPREPMAEAEDPEVMGDELAIVVFNLYQLGPMGRYIYRYISYIIRYHVMINIYITYIILYLFRTPNCSPQIMMAMESGSQKCWFEESKLLLWTKKWGFIFWFSILKWGSFGGRASMIRRMGHANIPCEGLPLCRWRCCFHVPNIYI